MTKEEEIPDWVGAQEFYDKYDPKEILGRWVSAGIHILGVASDFFFFIKRIQSSFFIRNVLICSFYVKT